MINIAETKGSIYKVEQKGNMVLARLQTGKKVNDTWENMWWSAKFVGKNKDKILQYGDKTRIKITSGIVEQNKYQDKFYTNVIIFDYEIVDGKLAPLATTEQFDDDSELPF